MKILSWNVNGIRKGIDEILSGLINDFTPDIICLQETRCTSEIGNQLFPKDKEYPYRFWNSSVKGHAGVAVWSKIKPIKVDYAVPNMFDIANGRVILLHFETFVLINTYVPNTGRGEVAENLRTVWHNALVNFLSEEHEIPIIWCGDLNVVDNPVLDTSHHKGRPTRAPPAGLKQFEKDQFDELLDMGFIDVFRTKHPEEKSFTWYSNFHSNVGWRLDYFLTRGYCIDSLKINHGPKMGSKVSDHTWMILELAS